MTLAVTMTRGNGEPVRLDALVGSDGEILYWTARDPKTADIVTMSSPDKWLAVAALHGEIERQREGGRRCIGER